MNLNFNHGYDLVNTPLISQFIVVKTTLPHYKDEWAVVDSGAERLLGSHHEARHGVECPLRHLTRT